MRRPARRIGAAALALGLSALCLDAARAQDVHQDTDISGAWTLQTKVFYGNCRMTGELELIPTQTPGEYVGRLDTHQRCGYGAAAVLDTRTEQAVRAVRDEDRLTITSSLEAVSPEWVSYAPDDFELEIVDGSLMSGELHGFSVIPARFKRGSTPLA